MRVGGACSPRQDVIRVGGACGPPPPVAASLVPRCALLPAATPRLIDTCLRATRRFVRSHGQSLPHVVSRPAYGRQSASVWPESPRSARRYELSGVSPREGARSEERAKQR